MSLVIDKEKIVHLKELLHASKRVLILSHMHPDGDAIGSSLGLSHLLKHHLSAATHISVVLPNRVPDYFGFLPGVESVLSAEDDMESCQRMFAEADLIIGVDFNNAPRIGALQLLLESSPLPKVLIDHHISPDEQLFDLVFSIPGISSACELVYWVGFGLWGDDCLTLESARCLYTGICTDTGSFAFSNEDSDTYEAVAALVRYPVCATEIHNEIFNTYSVARMQFLGFCLNNRLRIFEKEGFAYIYISKADQDRFGVDESDTEGFVNYTLQMRNIHVGALIKQTADKVRVSLRSKKEFDVNAFARQYLGGGGHVKAAGATSPFGFEDTVDFLEKKILEELRRDK